ncbi:MAG: tetratricopeptide repeat protein, partial [Nitrospirae bacterium]|nr:tetratricopeptide repeat protein [Nitrospirota bacterium]
ALNHAIGGLNPAGYHLVNLIFHVGSAFLVFLIVRAILPTSFFPALAAGLVFAVHPFNSEVVNYITARSSVMCAFFYLLAFWCWVKYREADVGRRGFFFYIASLVAFLSAMLSKEIAVTLPAVLGLYDLYFIPPRTQGRPEPPDHRRAIPGRRTLAYLPFVLLVVVPYLLLRKSYFGTAIGGNFSRDFLDNLILQPGVLTEYFRLLFFPSGLTIDHDIPLVRGLWEPVPVLSGIFLSLVLFAAYRLFRKGGEWKVVSFFIPWFFIAILPTTVLPLNAILQENRGYLSGVGFAVFAGVALHRMGRWGTRVPMALLILLVAVYSISTFQRNRVLENEMTLWSDAAAKAPRSARSHDNLGLAFFSRGDLENAEREFRETIRLNPGYYYAYYNLGVIYQSRDRLEDAIWAYRKTVERNRGFFRAYYNLGLVYKQRGQWDDAIRAYLRAIEIDSWYSFVYNNLGVVYYRKKDYPAAVRALDTAIGRDPAYARAYYNLGNVYFEMKKYDAAKAKYQEALRVAPGFEVAAMALRRIPETRRGGRPP